MPYTVLVEKIGLHNQTSRVQLQSKTEVPRDVRNSKVRKQDKFRKYQTAFFLVVFVSPQLVRNVVASTHFFARCATPCKDVTIRKYLCICLHLVLIKGTLVMVFKINAPLRHKTTCESESRKFDCQ